MSAIIWLYSGMLTEDRNLQAKNLDCMVNVLTLVTQ